MIFSFFQEKRAWISYKSTPGKVKYEYLKFLFVVFQKAADSKLLCFWHHLESLGKMGFFLPGVLFWLQKLICKWQFLFVLRSYGPICKWQLTIGNHLLFLFLCFVLFTKTDFMAKNWSDLCNSHEMLSFIFSKKIRMLSAAFICHFKGMSYRKVCFIRVLNRFQQSFSHILTVSGCGRELNALF